MLTFYNIAARLECKELMLLKQRDWPWDLATETMCSQSVTVGRSSLQRLFDVSKAFKFNPGESQGYSGFDLSQEKPYAISNNNKMPAIQRVGSKHKFMGGWVNPEISAILYWTQIYCIHIYDVIRSLYFGDIHITGQVVYCSFHSTFSYAQ